MPTLLSAINGGVRLADGSVVVSDRANFRIQRFDPKGEHLWSRGREGEGPGEFEYVRLALGCANAERIVVYDIRTDRVSVFSKEGELLDAWALRDPVSGWAKRVPSPETSSASFCRWAPRNWATRPRRCCGRGFRPQR